MEEQQVKIENEIFEKLKDKIKDTHSKEAQKIIEMEIRNRNYLSEEWQTDYAVQRIQEKIEEDRKKQRLLRGNKSTGQVHIKNFSTELEANLAKKILEKNGIKSVLQINRAVVGRMASLHVIDVAMFILEKDLEKANELLNQMKIKN